MSKVITRKIERKSDIDISELNTLYNQMIGIDKGDPIIIKEKYIKLNEHINFYLKLLDKFSKNEKNFLIQAFPEITTGMNEINKYVQDFRLFFNPLCNNDEIVNDDPILESDDLHTQIMKQMKYEEKINAVITEKYKKIKESAEVKGIIIFGGILNKYKKYIGNVNELNYSFIRNYIGPEFLIFPFSSLNIKLIYNSEDMSPNKILSVESTSYKINNYILLMLHKIYDKTTEIYKIISSPDIDAKKFGKILIQALTEIKQKIPRCNEAFKIIENSIGLFENNFGSYYKDFVMSKNPNVIIESFIVDIAESNTNNPNVKRQFAEIMKFFQKALLQNGNKKDPMVEKLFEKLQNNFNIFGE